MRSTALVVACCMLWAIPTASAAPPPSEAKKVKGKEGIRSFTGTLAEGDAIDKVLKQPVKVIPLTMTKGSAYLIDLKSTSFDPILRIETSDGAQLARLGNSGPGMAALDIDFIAPKDDEFQMLVSTANGKFGGYTLTIRPLGRPGDPGITLHEGRLKGDSMQEQSLKASQEHRYVIDLLLLGEAKAVKLVAEGGKKVLPAGNVGFGSDPRRARLEFLTETDDVLKLQFQADRDAPYLLRIRESRVFGSTLTVGPDEITIEEELTDADPKDTKRKNCHCKLFKVKMQAGRTYEIDMKEANGGFDTFLRLEGPDGKEAASDDDSGDENDARLRFMCKADGIYIIVATSYRHATGPFILSIREVEPK